ncbi:MAG: hypothetical protein V3T53_06170 [Phycisphaerales bacterium]
MQAMAGVHPQLPLAPTLGPLGDQPRAALDRLAAMGFRYVQLCATQRGLRPRDLDRSARRDLLVRLRRLEMQVSGLDLWIPPSHFLDPALVDRAVDAVRAALELAGDLQRCPISLELPRPTGDDSLGPVIETIAEQALRVGVELADHAFPDVTADRLGIGIDPAAQLSCNEDPAAVVTKHADRLVSARLCDLLASGMRGPIGEAQAGRLDVLSYRVALSVGGYDRPVVVDARQWSDPWPGLTQTARTWSAASTGDLTPQA